METRGTSEDPVRPVRQLVVITVAALSVLASVIASPRHFAVEGHSMGPALRPGDLVSTAWLPLGDHWRRPRRFDRWVVTLPDGTTGLKRVVGLPGESVTLVDGDLRIDARPVVKSPALLAELGSQVGVRRKPAGDQASWSLSPEPIMDEDPDEPTGPTRVLMPVCDAGFAAILDVDVPGDAWVRTRVGPVDVTWRLGAAGRHAIVAGRLDGHLVAGAWPLPGGVAWPPGSCLPTGSPGGWNVVRRWPGGPACEDRPFERPPILAVTTAHRDRGARATIREISVWRDVVHRSAADGVTRWSLGGDAFLVFGDRPSVSRDSRHFGPLPRASLRHRVHAAACP